MKSLNFIFLIILLFTSNLMYAKEETSQNGVRVGVGVTLIDMKELIVALAGGGEEIPNFYIPIDLSPTIRITPEFGLFQNTMEYNNYYKDEYFSDEYKYESKSSMYRIGLGIFLKTSKKAFNLYYGFRGGLMRGSTKEEEKYIGTYNWYGYNGAETDGDKEEEKTSGFYIGPAVGGEYFFSNHFSLGAEVQFKYCSYTIKEEDSEDNEKYTVSSMSTKPLVFIRFYF